MTKVLFLFQPEEQLRQYFSDHFKKKTSIEFIFPSQDEIDSNTFCRVNEADIIIGWRPSRELLIAAKKLQLLINPGAGVQHLLPEFSSIFKKQSIKLVNGHGNSYFTAQHTVALLLSCLNKVIPHHQWLSDGKWRTGDQEAASIPLKGRHIGLFGYGAINQKVHKFLKGFDVQFSILKKYAPKAGHHESLPVYTFQQLETFFNEIDILIIAAPLTELTANSIGSKQLKLLGKKGVIINVGRGEIINEKDLFLSLKDRIIDRAAIDVWYNNSPKTDEEGKTYPYSYPFHQLDNIILSPHRAASPMSDLYRWNEVIENIIRFHQGNNSFLNRVNIDDQY